MTRLTAVDQRSDTPAPPAKPSSEARRHAYLVALVVLVVIDVAALIAASSDAPTAVRVAHLLLPVVGGLLLVALWATRASAGFGAVAASVLAVTTLLRLGALVFGSGLDAPPSELGSAADAVPVVVYLLFFLAYDRVRAALASAILAVSAFALVAVGIAAVPDVALAEHLVGPLQVLALHAAIVGVLLVLSPSHDRVEQHRGAPGSGSGARIVAGTDEVGGVGSFGQLTSVLERELDRSERHLLPLSVILIGLDDLQTINERHGERAGDNVLMEVSSVLAGVLRSVDTVGRWGGDEFLVIAPTTGPDDAQALAMRCRYKLRHHPMPEVGPVTASFGVSTFEIGDDTPALVGRATDALADAKAAGRDRVQVTSLESRIAGETRRRSDSGT